MTCASCKFDNPSAARFCEQCGTALEVKCQRCSATVSAGLLNATARAYRWSNDLLTGRARSIGEIARREHLTGRHVRRVMRLAFLAPRIVEAIAEGRQPGDLSTIAMTQRIELPPLWSAQEQALDIR